MMVKPKSLFSKDLVNCCTDSGLLKSSWHFGLRLCSDVSCYSMLVIHVGLFSAVKLETVQKSSICQC